MAKLYTKNTWTDETLAGAERYDILDNGGTPIDSNVQINLATAVVQAGTTVNAARMNNIEDGLDAVDTRLDNLDTAVDTAAQDQIHAATGKTTPADADEIGVIDSAAANVLKKLTWANLKATLKTYLDTLYRPVSEVDGWIAAGETWTRTGANTFTVTGDVTAKYKAGVKIKLTDTTTKYFYVLSSSYGAPNTTVTITGGSDYALVGAISNPYYSRTATPAGFPVWFNNTMTWASDGATQPVIGDGTLYSAFKMDGDWVTWSARMSAGSTTTFGVGFWKFSLPVPQLTSSPTRTYFGLAYARDAATANYSYLTQVSTDDLIYFKYFILTTAATNLSRLDSATPITWGNGDSISWTCSYRAM